MRKNTKKLIVLSGVTRGLGKVMLDGFIREGHVVQGCGRDSSALESLREKHPELHGFARVDVSDDAAVAAWAADVISRCGPPDFLINNAAVINSNSSLWKIPAAEFDRVIDVNIKGVANLIRHFVPAMVERKSGVIVNFSSGWGRAVAADVAPYCATKFAIEGLTQALAMELPPGMAAIPLNPGVIDTDMLRSCFGDAAMSHPSPTRWAERAVPFILGLSARENGHSVTVE